MVVTGEFDLMGTEDIMVWMEIRIQVNLGAVVTQEQMERDL